MFWRSLYFVVPGSRDNKEKSLLCCPYQSTFLLFFQIARILFCSVFPSWKQNYLSIFDAWTMIFVWSVSVCIEKRRKSQEIHPIGQDCVPLDTFLVTPNIDGTWKADHLKPEICMRECWMVRVYCVGVMGHRRRIAMKMLIFCLVMEYHSPYGSSKAVSFIRYVRQ